VIVGEIAPVPAGNVVVEEPCAAAANGSKGLKLLARWRLIVDTEGVGDSTSGDEAIRSTKLGEVLELDGLETVSTRGRFCFSKVGVVDFLAVVDVANGLILAMSWSERDSYSSLKPDSESLLLSSKLAIFVQLASTIVFFGVVPEIPMETSSF